MLPNSLIFTHLREIDRDVVSKDSEKEKVQVVITEKVKNIFLWEILLKNEMRL